MAFIDAHFRSGHPLARHRDLFDWQYGNGDTYNMVIATDPSSDEILGVLGFVDSVRYDPALAPRNCVWLALWQVHPGVRIPSLGPLLLKFLQEHVRHETLAVSGIRSALVPLYRAMRFDVRVLAHHYLLNPTIREHHLAVVPEGSALPQPAPTSDLRLHALTKATFVDDTRRALQVERRPGKSATYFYNRYLSHPFYDYLVFEVLRGTSSVGLVAARVVAHNGRRALRIVDLLLDHGDVAGLGAPFLDLIVAAGCEYGDLLQSGLDDATLRAAGFSKVTPESGVIVPNYFEPFVRQNTEIIACVRDEASARFIVCKADGDQDRPNLLQRD